MIAAGLLRLRGFWPRSVLSGRQALHEGTSDNDASGGKTLRACVRADANAMRRRRRSRGTKRACLCTFPRMADRPES